MFWKEKNSLFSNWLIFGGKKWLQQGMKILKINQNLSQLPTTWKGASDFFFYFHMLSIAKFG